ncbi:MepB family protein [Flavobacterium sp.]|uniref:MepB family protein n=1 Tax=Flavobacterium sp. TaxID=239 RepID=UPI0040488F7B
MDNTLKRIQEEIYTKCNLQITNFEAEKESKEYGACRFLLNNLNIVYRNAKTTPTKRGQFVTFWKRNNKGPIEPLHENDLIDFYVVNVQLEDKMGQFVFPKAILIEKGIISTDTKEGKRAFRVYPNWDIANNKQAEKSQKWQLHYFYKIKPLTDLKKASELYNEYSLH